MQNRAAIFGILKKYFDSKEQSQMQMMMALKGIRDGVDKKVFNGLLNDSECEDILKAADLFSASRSDAHTYYASVEAILNQALQRPENLPMRNIVNPPKTPEPVLDVKALEVVCDFFNRKVDKELEALLPDHLKNDLKNSTAIDLINSFLQKSSNVFLTAMEKEEILKITEKHYANQGMNAIDTEAKAEDYAAIKTVIKEALSRPENELLLNAVNKTMRDAVNSPPKKTEPALDMKAIEAVCEFFDPNRNKKFAARPDNFKKNFTNSTAIDLMNSFLQKSSNVFLTAIEKENISKITEKSSKKIDIASAAKAYAEIKTIINEALSRSENQSLLEAVNKAMRQAPNSSANILLQMGGAPKDPSKDPLNNINAALDFIRNKPAESEYFKYAEVVYKWKLDVKFLAKVNPEILLDVCKANMGAAAKISDSRLLCGKIPIEGLKAILAAHEGNPMFEQVKKNFASSVPELFIKAPPPPPLSPEMEGNVEALKKLNLNPYTILGVNENATEAEIKKAYYAQAKILHPDKNPGNKSATEAFKVLIPARDILLDQDARKWYVAPTMSSKEEPPQPRR